MNISNLRHHEAEALRNDNSSRPVTNRVTIYHLEWEYKSTQPAYSAIFSNLSPLQYVIMPFKNYKWSSTMFHNIGENNCVYSSKP